jgi:CRISPR-associated protein Csm3
METAIDRIQGVAAQGSLRNTERVPAGARFDFRLTVRIHDNEDLLDDILHGLRLLELTGIGGSGSRGYGKLRFDGLQRDGKDLMGRLQAIEV